MFAIGRLVKSQNYVILVQYESLRSAVAGLGGEPRSSTKFW
jgi:hypothetical protein